MHLIDIIAARSNIKVLSDLRISDAWYKQVQTILNEEENVYSLHEWNQFFEYVGVKPRILKISDYDDIKRLLVEFESIHDLKISKYRNIRCELY